MKFYPARDLYHYYRRYSDNSWISKRIEDHTIRRSVDLMNNALNYAEDWEVFIDIGAGNGRNSAALIHKFKRGYAVEIDPNDTLGKLAKTYEMITVIPQSIQKAKIKEKADFIVLSDVFEHIPPKDIPAFVKKLWSLQKPGGVLYILTPNPAFCGPAPQSGIFHTRHPFGHYKHYSALELEELLSPLGYRAVFFRYEDSRIRLVAKMAMIVLSSLDRKISDIPVIREITAPFVSLINAILEIIGIGVYWSEVAHQHDDLDCRSIVGVFKLEAST